MKTKRYFDLFFSITGLVVLAPLFTVLAVLIKLDSRGPVFFRQERVGRFGKLFRIFKFRTMLVDNEGKGTQITVRGDLRITRVGRFLRRYKLDELPQLINVLLGQMSLVGPRPEVPRYVALYPSEVRELVLSVPPGITDYASIEYRDESELLYLSGDPESTYINNVIPIKLRYYEKYVRDRSLWVDLKLIFATIRSIPR